jgi:hypothetical protein
MPLDVSRRRIVRTLETPSNPAETSAKRATGEAQRPLQRSVSHTTDAAVADQGNDTGGPTS